MPLKVAIVINALDLGGTETIVRRLATEAAARGHQVRVCAVRRLGPGGRALRRAGIGCTTLGVRGGLRGSPGRATLGALHLGAQLRRWRVDVVQSFLFEGNAVARLAARRAGVPVVPSFRSNVFRLPAERLLEQSTGCWVSHYTAVSRRVAHEASHSLGIDPSRIDVIYNGVAPSTSSAPPNELRILGFLGRLHREKGAHLLLQALGRLGRDAPELMIAGEGPEREHLEALAGQLGLRRVRFVGRVDNPSQFLESVDALCVPALGEGFSNAALEAMAHARPVVASDAGGNCELVQDGETGFVVPPGDVEALARSLRRLGEDASLAQLGGAGRERVKRHFTVDEMVTRYLRLWDRVRRAPLPWSLHG